MSTTFRRRIEDFTCIRCGREVKGDGYTNHCPHCLYSLHVDVHPGDRASACGGVMKPVAVSAAKGDYVILHRCTICGYEKPNRRAPNDDFSALLTLARVDAELKNRKK